MSSWFMVTLQTQPPIIEISIAPFSMKEPNAITPVFIHSNVPLGASTVHTVDSAGVVREHIFENNGLYLYGELPTNMFPLGIVRIYTTCEDTVANVSEEVMGATNVIPQGMLRMRELKSVRPISSSPSVRHQIQTSVTRKITATKR